jgi:hypothetical protein
MSGVPYVFGNATTSIPLSQLDVNFATNATLGNASVGLGNTTTIVGNLTLQNPTISGGTAFTLGNTAVTYGGTTTSVGNLTVSNISIVSTNGDATIHGVTVGQGGGSVSTNTALGVNALNATNTGGFNTGVGDAALQNNTSGAWNAAFGFGPLNSNTSGSYNTSVGGYALVNNTTGSNNVAIGYQAGSNITTGSSNIYIGPGSPQASSASANNEININTQGSAGKGSSTGFISPNGGGVYQGNNSLNWSITSDERLKKNIVDNTVGLTAINGIKVRNFEYRLPDEITDLDKSNAVNITGVQIGPIAQELQQVLPDCVKTESTGVMSVDSSDVLWHLVTAVQQLSAQLTTAQADIAALKAKVGV